MNTLQALLDGMSAQWQRERAATQMTLGELIDALSAIPADTPIANLTGLHSYRGYYSDLALELEEGTRTAAALLAECQAAMGETFEGYKGGDFMMGRNTPIWVSEYGCSSGMRLMAIGPNGEIKMEQEE